MKSFTFLFLLLLIPAGQVLAQEPDQPPSVHREQVYTGGGAESCLRCHSGEKMRAVADSAHGNMENMYTPLATQGCEACHGPGSIHISRAHGGAGFPKMINFGRGKSFSQREVQVETCLACHRDDEGGTSIIEWYSSSHNRKNINCSTCHLVHEALDPMQDADQQVARCNRCHRKDLKNHDHFEDSDIDFESMSCGACHNVHEAFDREGRHGASGE